MRRVIVVIAGVLLAFLAGCCFLAAALLAESLAVPAQTSLALFNVAALIVDSLQAGEAGHLVGAGLRAIWMALLLLCLAPVCAVALLGEAVGMRSLVWAAGATGAATAAVPTAMRAVLDPSRVAGGAGEGRATLILFLTGLVAGFVYWIVAGRDGAIEP